MEVPRYWRLNKQKLRLEGVYYIKCQHVDLAGSPVCRQCKEEETDLMKKLIIDNPEISLEIKERVR
jgi:hypothetical protein